MLVADLMTRNAASVRVDRTLAHAAHLMWDIDCGALPVIDGDNGKIIGMLTDRDICMASWSRGAAPDAIGVADAMSQHVVHCLERDSVDRAKSLMQSNQIRRLPVVDGAGRLVGILSLADIARAENNAQSRKLVPSLTGDGLAATLAGICRSPISRREVSAS